MRKTYIIPEIEIYQIQSTDGILQVTSNFNLEIGGDTGVDNGEDFGRENNWGREQNNVWDQGW
ncbi:MAG: hypothetical protein IKT87_04020 [Bacteroidaceae bacterium]|nr:hypothetical protein [Bacteroidaceae bacterium]